MFVAGHHADLFISGRSILHVGDCWEDGTCCSAARDVHGRYSRR